jgi:hypothetical protein
MSATTDGCATSTRPTIGGLLMAGYIVPVPGVTVIGPHEREWSHLDPGDYRARQRVPTQIMLHKTIADDPEQIVPGAGPAGGAERTARYWQELNPDGSEKVYSGAHIVIGHDGVVACLADLVYAEAYHATVSNPFSIGIEICELVGGRSYEAAMNAAVAVVFTIAEHLGIQLQMHAGYTGHPLRRMLGGGRDMIGIFGHRNNTERRGRWDPGDRIFEMLRAKGVENFDFDSYDDIAAWKQRQAMLGVVADGLPGPKTRAALQAAGYRSGIYALGKA